MPDTLKYIVDDSGQKSSVLVPLKVWEELNVNYQKLQRKLDILNGIKEGLNEVKQARRNKKELQTLKDFLK